MSCFLVFALVASIIIPEVDVMGESGLTHTSGYSRELADYSIDIDAGNKLFDLSDLMYGIFLEDINASCDGGLSAEMVENRSFEYGSKYGCNPKSKWKEVGAATCEVKDGSVDSSCLNVNNPHYMVISGTDAGVANEGYLDGMAVNENEKYIFSIYAKGLDGYTGKIHADIMVDGSSAASGVIEGVTSEWKQYKLELTPDTTAASTNTDKSVKLQVTIDDGSCAIDMVSLMPADNIGGFRPELVETIKEMHPSFFRFPGGCVTEGTATAEDAYNWKQSIGCDDSLEPVMFNGVYGDEAARRIGENNDWSYYMSYDLGFYEYFVLCEYLDTLAVPVLNAGLGCDVRGAQGGYSGEELQKYIQMALDLVEFCRGGADTKWGAVRISMGHAEPFKLKYIGIGNEQNNDTYFSNYSEFVKAFAEAARENPQMYGDIQLAMSPIIGEGTGWLKSNIQRSYTYASDWLDKNPDYTKEQWASVYDHHNYNTPEWFFKNCDYYAPTNYSRTDCKGNYGGMFNVFLGEYAAHVEDTPNALIEALAEAVCMTSLEHNGDIVTMACYAPLFCSVNKVNWKWNMIYFDNDEVLNTTNYYAQKMFMNNTGSKQLYSRLMGAEKVAADSFDGKVSVNSEKPDGVSGVKVTDENNGTVYTEDGWKDTSFSGCTIEAEYNGGEASFDFAVKDDKNYSSFCISSDGRSSIKTVSNGKEKEIASTVGRITDSGSKPSHIKIDVDRKQVKCFVDGKEYAFYNVGDTDAEAYQSVNLDKNGDIIVKLVNVTDSDKTFAVSVDNAQNMKSMGKAFCLTGDDAYDKNEMGSEDNMATVEESVNGLKDKFNYTVPKYSVTILRIPTDDSELPPVTPEVTPTEPSQATPAPANNVNNNQAGTGNTDNAAQQTNDAAVIKKGTVFTKGDLVYRVTKTGKNGSVSVTGVTKKARSKSSIKIPAVVKYKNNRYSVSAIASKALKNVKKLKKLTVGKNIKTVGKQILPKTANKVRICIPAARYKACRNMINKSGVNKKKVVYKKLKK